MPINNYHELKRNCLVPYSIGNKRLTIGNLNNVQLEIAYNILNKIERDRPLTELETRQQSAIEYVVKYRHNSTKQRASQKNAEESAELITRWVQKVYKN